MERRRMDGPSDDRVDSTHPVVVLCAILVLLACVAGPSLLRDATRRADARLASAAAASSVASR
jgi:hypothetical protein